MISVQVFVTFSAIFSHACDLDVLKLLMCNPLCKPLHSFCFSFFFYLLWPI